VLAAIALYVVSFASQMLLSAPVTARVSRRLDAVVEASPADSVARDEGPSR